MKLPKVTKQEESAMSEFRNVQDLRPHPANARVYGDGADEALVASVRALGVLIPLLVTGDDLIVSGRRRWLAARKVGLEKVPVEVFTSTDELDLLEALVHANTQRVKTKYQVALEAEALFRVERERAKRRQQEAGKAHGRGQEVQEPVPEAVEGDCGQASDKVGAALGICGKTAEVAEKVVKAIREEEENGHPGRAEQLKGVLNTRGFGPAFDALQEAGPTTPPAVRNHHCEFQTLVATPAWAGLARKDLHALPVGEIADIPAVLFLWTDSERLADALAALRAWGFTYENVLTWLRDAEGRQTAHCLVGVRSAPWARYPVNIQRHVLWPNGAEDVWGLTTFWDFVERQLPGPKALLFASGPREGWVAFDLSWQEVR